MTRGALAAWDALWQGCAAYTAAGATVVQRDRIRWFASGVGYEGLNGVFVAPGTSAVPVEDALRTFHRMGVPALWHVAVAGADRSPPGAEPIAALPGMSWYEDEPLLVADDIGRHPPPGAPGLSVFRVAGVTGMREWVRLWSGRRSGPVFDGTLHARMAARPAFTHLLAVVAGRPVGCAAAFVGRGAGEVQHVLTVPAMRRKGIGTALTVAALRVIAARVGTAVLTSSPDGLRIYRGLGFQQVGTVRRYLWSPGDPANGVMITRPDGSRNIAVPSSDVGVRSGYPARAWVERPVMPS